MREEGFALLKLYTKTRYLYRYGEGCLWPEFFAKRVLPGLNYHLMIIMALLDDGVDDPYRLTERK